MNIWFISKYVCPPQYSKFPSRLFHLAREISALGHNAFLLTSDANHFSDYAPTTKVYNDEFKDGVNIRWVRTFKYVKTASIRRVLSWFDFERKLFMMKLNGWNKPDVVIASSLSIFSIFYGYYLKRKYGAFLVFEIRDIWPLTMTEEGGFSKWHPLVLLIGFTEKFGYAKADLIVGTMPRLDLHVKNILGYEKPVFCSPLGFNPDDYKDRDLDTINSFLNTIPQNKTIVGYAGSMGITNALESFVDTIKLMAENNSVHFLLVGGGDLRESFQEQLKGYTNVTFIERIDQNKVKSFLNNCDILYLSTKDSKVWDYGQSMNKVVEYMLAAKPIIATYTGYPSMINEANCGTFVNSSKPEDLKAAILHYSNMSKEERDQIGENGRAWILKNRIYSDLAKDYIKNILAIKDKER